MNRWGRRRQVLLVIAATVATACSASVEVIGPTTSTSVVATSSTTSSVVDLSDLVGDWDNGQLFLQVADDGSYQVLETLTSDPNDPLMSGFVARDGINVIFVTNIYGECSGQTGVYQALMTEGQLVLTLVDDPCQFRATRFVSPWEKTG